jgi:S-adenosylmethionine:tRNA ribosyltransferase-isomerase
MLVAHRGTGELVHARVADLPDNLHEGDLVVVNTSGTLPAALDALAADGTRLVLHLSTRLEGDRWVVEPRRIDGGTTARWSPDDDGPPPTVMALGEGACVELREPYLGGTRLWVADVHLPEPALAWLLEHGRAIRYRYVDHAWPIEAYQNVYATVLGSAEMPSAGRPLTPEVITRLVAKGVGVTPVVLHTGVASLEADELPYPERLVVPPATARRVRSTRAAGGRVIAVGTTVVRALESAADPRGGVQAYDGWTDVVITPERGVRVVDGLLTGWHEPEASHLLMLEAIAGRELLERSYAASLAEGYLWHEFGDGHLILP